MGFSHVPPGIGYPVLTTDLSPRPHRDYETTDQSAQLMLAVWAPERSEKGSILRGPLLRSFRFRLMSRTRLT